MLIGGTLRLGRIWGIPLEISYSWFLIFFLVTYSLTVQFGHAYPVWSGAEQVGVALVTSLLFFGSVLAHELSHSLVARRKGIPVHRITLFIFGGVAQIGREANRPSEEAAIAVVGPLASLAIGGMSYGLYHLFLPVSDHLAAVAFTLFPINVALAIFNMIPGFPLDGGRVFRAAIWGVSHSYGLATRVASIAGQVVAAGFILGGIAIGLFLGGILQGVWLVFIGWFLQQAAAGTYRQFRVREGLKSYAVRHLMDGPCPTVETDVTLDRLMGWYAPDTRRRCFAVARQGTFVGLLTERDLKAIPREQWPVTSAGSVMRPLERLKVVGPDDDALGVLEAMEDAELEQIAVARDGVLLGLVTRDRVLSLVRSRLKGRA